MSITKKDLQRKVDFIVNKLGLPKEGWTQDIDGNKANVGHIALDHNAIYGGWDLNQIMNESGGINSWIGNDFAGRGRLKAHEMETFLLGVVKGLEIGGRNV
jgi:hypothetical protein